MTKCLICGSGIEKTIKNKKGMEYFICGKCEFIFRDRNTLISQGEELKVYERHNNSYENKGYVDYFKHFVDTAIVPFCASSGRNGFDFGSGPSPVLAKLLTKQYGYNMEIYDKFYATEKTYINNTYDLITSTEVIEHLDNPIEYFKLFKNHLKEDGILAIMTLFHLNNEKHFLDWFYMRDMTHISFYTPKTLKTLASLAGFKVIFCDNHRCLTLMLDS